MPSTPSVAGHPRRWAAAAAVCLAVLLVAVRLTVTAGDPQSGRWALLTAIGACWLTFAAAVVAVRRSPLRLAVPLIVAGGVALQLVAISSPPRLTDDFYRYAWDGRVQAAGISPYRYLPTDPALAALRTDWLFPTTCAAPSPLCTRLNHPRSPTIYPPVAQGEFVVVHWLSAPWGPDGGKAGTWQLVAATLASATTLAMIRLLRRHGDPRHAVLWAWCPTVVLECGGNAHVDVLAALLVVLAFGAAVGGRPRRAGALAGAAVATKLLPLLVLPSLLAPVPGLRDGGARWRAWTRQQAGLLVAGALTLIGVYLPHVLAVGPRVLGFLPGYLAEEGYDGRARFPLLRPWLPEQLAAVAGIAVIVAAAWLVARRGDRTRPWVSAAALIATTFTVLGVSYPWYALLLVAPAALAGRGALLTVAAAAYPSYLAPALGLPFSTTLRVAYGGAVAVVVIGLAAHRRRARAPDARSRSQGDRVAAERVARSHVDQQVGPAGFEPTTPAV